MTKRKLGLPQEYFGAILDGMDPLLVDPLVGPTVAMIDEYLPEEWVSFIEEKSPILMFFLALFEAEQSFGQRVDALAGELKRTAAPAPAARAAGPVAAAGSGTGYPAAL